MENYQLIESIAPHLLASEALDGVLKAHASLDALMSQVPEDLRLKIHGIVTSIARSAREIDEIVRSLGHCTRAYCDDRVANPEAFFAAADVEELVDSLPGPTITLRGPFL